MKLFTGDCVGSEFGWAVVSMLKSKGSAMVVGWGWAAIVVAWLASLASQRAPVKEQWGGTCQCNFGIPVVSWWCEAIKLLGCWALGLVTGSGLLFQGKF